VDRDTCRFFVSDATTAGAKKRGVPKGCGEIERWAASHRDLTEFFNSLLDLTPI